LLDGERGVLGQHRLQVVIEKLGSARRERVRVLVEPTGAPGGAGSPSAVS
jgi:hypothetical protein